MLFRPACLLVLSLALTLSFSGCSDDGTVTTSSPANPAALATGGASTLFVITASGTQVQSFSLKGTGTAATTLTLPTLFQAAGIAVDPNSSTLYVVGTLSTAGTNFVTSEVLAYPTTATGAATPARTISEGAGNFPAPAAMTVDAKGQLYVAGAGAIAVYAATATGAATPVQLITGTATQLAPTGQAITGLGIAVDAAGNLYDTVRTYTSGNVQTVNVFVFSNGSTGNVAPMRTVTAPAADTNVYGPVVDSAQNMYLVEELPSLTAAASIAEYTAGATGTATPFASIRGGPISFLGGLQRDGVGNLYTINETSAGYALFGYGPNATGTVATPGLNLTLSGVTSMSYQIALQ